MTALQMSINGQHQIREPPFVDLIDLSLRRI